METTSMAPGLRERLSRELLPGEKISWQTQPRPFRGGLGDWGGFFFAIPWTLFSLFWMTAALGALDMDHGWALRMPKFDGPRLGFGLFGLPFVMIGFWMLSGPWRAQRRRRKAAAGSLYVITDRRLIVIDGGMALSALPVAVPRWKGEPRVVSLSAEEVNVRQRMQNADGSGEILFGTPTSEVTAAENMRQRVGLYGLANVHEVEQKLQQLASGGEPPVPPPTRSLLPNPSFPKELQDLVRSEFQGGENIRWMCQPDARVEMPKGFVWGPFVMGIFIAGFTVLWMKGPVSGAFRGHIIEIVFALFGLPLVVASVTLLSAPFWAARKIRQHMEHTLYVITDRRAIIVDDGFAQAGYSIILVRWLAKYLGKGGRMVRSFLPAQLQNLQVTESPNGCRDFIFEQYATRDSEGDRVMNRYGMLQVPAAKAAEGEMLLRELAATPAGTDEAPPVLSA